MTTTTIGKYTVETKVEERGITAKAFYIKRNGWPKYLWHYRFKSEKEMNDFLATFRKDVQEKEEWHQERKEIRKKERKDHGIEPGQIYYTSWGYEQTNIDFFLVTAVKGQKISYVKIGQKADHTAHMSGQTAPNADVVISKEKTAMATGEKSFKAQINDESSRHKENAYLYTGGTLYFSYYY